MFAYPTRKEVIVRDLHLGLMNLFSNILVIIYLVVLCGGYLNHESTRYPTYNEYRTPTTAVIITELALEIYTDPEVSLASMNYPIDTDDETILSYCSQYTGGSLLVSFLEEKVFHIENSKVQRNCEQLPYVSRPEFSIGNKTKNTNIFHDPLQTFLSFKNLRRSFKYVEFLRCVRQSFKF